MSQGRESTVPVPGGLLSIFVVMSSIAGFPITPRRQDTAGFPPARRKHLCRCSIGTQRQPTTIATCRVWHGGTRNGRSARTTEGPSSPEKARSHQAADGGARMNLQDR